MKKWLIFDLIMALLIIGAFWYGLRYIRRQADVQMQSGKCPTWLQDSPQERCK